MDKDLSASEQELRDRENELREVQRIAMVGGVVVDLRDGFKNRRSPEYLAIHGLPPEAANETHEDWVARLHPDDRERAAMGGDGHARLPSGSGASVKVSAVYVETICPVCG